MTIIMVIISIRSSSIKSTSFLVLVGLTARLVILVELGGDDDDGGGGDVVDDDDDDDDDKHKKEDYLHQLRIIIINLIN